MDLFKKMIDNNEKITRIDDHIPTKEELEESLKDIPKEEVDKYKAEAQAFIKQHKIKVDKSV